MGYINKDKLLAAIGEENGELWTVKGIKAVIDGLPTVQADVPDTNVGDLISRQTAIDAVECLDWYHQNKNGEMVHGANSKEDQPWYKAQDIYDALEKLPPAQPLTEVDYIELHDRFGEFVEFVVRDMISGKEERWGKKI